MHLRRFLGCLALFQGIDDHGAGRVARDIDRGTAHVKDAVNAGN